MSSSPDQQAEGFCIIGSGKNTGVWSIQPHEKATTVTENGQSQISYKPSGKRSKFTRDDDPDDPAETGTAQTFRPITEIFGDAWPQDSSLAPTASNVMSLPTTHWPLSRRSGREPESRLKLVKLTVVEIACDLGPTVYKTTLHYVPGQDTHY